jgi:hypothetical protein
MTVEQIFERYEVPQAVARDAYARAGWARAVHAVWLGPVLTWSQVYQALLFTDLGDTERTRTVRKKVGLNKYVTTLIARADPRHLQSALTQKDVHQLVYLYCLGRDDRSFKDACGALWARIRDEVECLCLDVPDTATSAHLGNTLANMDILHYKNPSV